MKKFFSLIAAFVVLIMGGIIFTACGVSNNITSVTIYANSDEGLFLDYDSNKSNEAEKRYEYTLNLTYGETVDLSKITVTCNRERESYKINEKTDSSDGYVLTSTFPTDKLANTGTYKLTYTYAGWTNVVNVVVNRLIVETPRFDEQDNREVYYDGNDYTRRIKYNKNLVTIVSAPEIRKEPIEAYDETRYYQVEFKLNDTNNYCWNWQSGATGEYLTGNFIFNFAINKVDIVIETDEFVKIDKENYIEEKINDWESKVFQYKLSEGKSLDNILDEIVDKSIIQKYLTNNVVEFKVIPHNSSEKVTELNEAGLYDVKLVNLEPNHYTIVSTNPANGQYTSIEYSGEAFITYIRINP